MNMAAVVAYGSYFISAVPAFFPALALARIYLLAHNRPRLVYQGLKNEFQGIRGGKADPAMLDHVQVDMYGTMSNLSEVAQVSMKGPQLMMLTMYDPGMTEVVAAAVRDCDMGLNPSVDGQNQVSVPIPKTSKESRDALVKIAAKHAEKTKVVLRGIRHKVSDKVKKKKDLFSLDDVHVRLKEVRQGPFCVH
ncbi:unnamed protein product [Discosporangium mesarthrocarpum]